MNSNKLLQTFLLKNRALVRPQTAQFSDFKRKPRNKKKETLMNVAKLSPHLALATLFLATSNSHLLIIPFITGGAQWMYMNRHFTRMTLYYDLYKLGNNQNHVLAYTKSREILLTDPAFSLYITQPQHSGIEDVKTLIIENPVFKPFSFKLEGTTGRIDDKRTRYSFDCAFRDITKETEGRIQSLIIFNDKSEAYFESFTVLLEKPVEKTIRVQEAEIEEAPNQGKANRPKKVVVEQPQQTQTKYRNF